MRNWSRAGLLVLPALLAAATMGCQKDSGVERAKRPKPKLSVITPKDNVPDVEPKGAQGLSAGPVKTPEPPPPAKMPEVVMPAELLQTCLVKVGDAMPDGELVDLEGKKHQLGALRGEKLTVVLFWAGENLYATKALEDLQPNVAEPYGRKGVRVIGVNVGEKPEAARKAAQDASVKYTNLVDADGSYFAKVAKEKLPRIYLLDGAGKILWFDTEYSDSTQRQLIAGIKVKLGER